MKKIRALKICAVTVEVYEALPEECPELMGDAGCVADGAFCSETSRIFLRVGQSSSQRRDSLIHELSHAFLYLSGIGHMLEASVQDAAKYAKFEEVLIRLATPHIIGLVEANGRIFPSKVRG